MGARDNRDSSTLAEFEGRKISHDNDLFAKCHNETCAKSKGDPVWERGDGQVYFGGTCVREINELEQVGYPKTGNVNKSALLWALIASLTKGSLVTLDGQPFCVDGRFVEVPPEVVWI